MDPKDPQDPATNPAGAPTDTPPAPTPADEPKDQPAPPDQGGEPTDQPDQPADQPDAGELTPTDGKKPAGAMPRGERRIRQLSSKVKQAHQQPYQPGGQQPPSPQFPSYQPGEEVPAERLQQDVVQTASAIAELQVNRQLAQRDAVSNFERDSEVLPGKFDELNPDNDAYTPELDEAIAQEFQERAFVVVGYTQDGQPITQLDPRVRLGAIAERHVKAARGYAAKVSAGVQTRHDAAADTTAPKPGGDRPADRKFEDLSLDEMRAKVGYHKT